VLDEGAEESAVDLAAMVVRIEEDRGVGLARLGGLLGAQSLPP
jgi:hypothetical protein